MRSPISVGIVPESWLSTKNLQGSLRSAPRERRDQTEQFIQSSQRREQPNFSWISPRKLVALKKPERKKLQMFSSSRKKKVKQNNTYSEVNEVSNPISVGIVPESWLPSKALQERSHRRSAPQERKGQTEQSYK